MFISMLPKLRVRASMILPKGRGKKVEQILHYSSSERANIDYMKTTLRKCLSKGIIAFLPS